MRFQRLGKIPGPVRARMQTMALGEGTVKQVTAMAIIGYHASHEQFTPSSLLRYAVLAGQAGFKALNSSDHFHPWSERQGQSGFSFAWLGAALQATALPCGVVCAPGQRYHPA